MASLNSSIDPHVDSQIRTVIRKSGIPLGKFAEAVGWKNLDALNWWSEKGGKLRQSNLDSLAQYLGISSDSLIQQSCDYALIRQRIFGGPTSLPENYSEQASSYVRTLAHIIEYLSMLHGRHFTDQLLRSLNIHPLFFDDLNNKININFYVDVFNQLSKLGVPDEDIASLACFIFLKLRDTEIGKKFREAKNHQESYSILAQHATQFETNFEYDFQIESDLVRIIARPSDAASILFEKSPEEYSKLFQYRKNVFSWFPTLSNLSPLSITTPQCILKGDAQTVYEAHIPKELQEEPDQKSFLTLLNSI